MSQQAESVTAIPGMGRRLAPSPLVDVPGRLDSAPRAVGSTNDALLDIARAVSVQHRTRPDLFRAIADALRGRLTFDRLLVFLQRPEHKEARVGAVEMNGLDLTVSEGEAFPLETSAVGRAIENRRPIICSTLKDLRPLPASREVMGKQEMNSGCVLPLVTAGRSVGALWFLSRSVGEYDGTDLGHLAEMALIIALALDNWLANEEIARLKQQLELEQENVCPDEDISQFAELEKRVIERTHELETFAYSISHDLRAPLRAIDGFSQLLWEDHAGRLGDEGRRVLDIIRQNARFMGKLIEDLLAFFGLTRKEMHPAEIQMSDLVRDTFDELIKTTTNARHRLDIKCLPAAYGDRSMMRQVFANLLSNAMKFSDPKPAPLIEVGYEQRGGSSVYYVRDNGVGFDDRYAHKLFRVFQRLHSADDFEGTGVGLAIAQQIIQRHGGRIWAEGEPDRGATIYFTLPSWMVRTS